MISDEDIKKILDFYNNTECPWIWVDITTRMGPTRLEEFFSKKISGHSFNHWSPATPEGYLEITMERSIVIHWIAGEEDKIVNISCVDKVDFDEIDKSLASTIIHNSVIRIMSEKF